MEISQAFTTCFSALPQFVYLAGQEAPLWWIDVFKTLVATFVGAGLAFCTNFYFQFRQRKSDQKTAGNLALATLSRQYGDFVIAKASLEKELKLAQLSNPEIPLWRALKPTLHEFNSELLLDFKSLAFLVEDGSDTLFVSLVDVESKYHDLRRMLAKHTAAASQLQQKIVALEQHPQALQSEDSLKHAVGFDLFGELDSLTTAIKNRVTTHEAVYVAAGKQLQALMIAKFKDKVFSFRALGAKAGLSQLDGGNAKPR